MLSSEVGKSEEYLKVLFYVAILKKNKNNREQKHMTTLNGKKEIQHKPFKVRLGNELHENLKTASILYKADYPEIARKAVKKARRLAPDLSNVEPGTTYEGEAFSFDLKGLFEGDADTFRRILTWYLSLHDLTKKPIAEFNPDGLTEGEHYNIVTDL